MLASTASGEQWHVPNHSRIRLRTAELPTSVDESFVEPDLQWGMRLRRLGGKHLVYIFVSGFTPVPSRLRS